MRGNYKGKKGRPRLTTAGVAIVVLVCMGLLLLVSYGVMNLLSSGEDDAASTSAPASTTGATQAEPQPGVVHQLTPDMSYTGDLILINSDYPIRRDFDEEDLMLIYGSGMQIGFGLLDATMLLPESVLTPLSEMFGASKQAGSFQYFLYTTYVSMEAQQALYDEAEDETRVAKPGCSEHNLALGIDVRRTGGAMEGSEEAEWLRENCWKYGFILRYPPEKSSVTGISYDPWHLRYVGKTHAAVMRQKGFCLEEYLDYLKSEKVVEVRGSSYVDDCVIYYGDSYDTTEIELPSNPSEVSGDNRGGVIFICPTSDS